MSRIYSLHARQGASGPAKGHWLDPNAGSLGDRAGNSVVSEGDWRVIGLPARDIEGRENQGTVQVYRQNLLTGAWEFQRELTASDGAAGDEFDFSPARDGERSRVGAFDRSEGAQIDQGAAYIFERHAGGPENWS